MIDGTSSPRRQGRGHWFWPSSLRDGDNYIRPCRPISVALPMFAFALVEAASYILPVRLTGQDFGLWREFVRERQTGEIHVVYVLMTHPQGGPIAPTRLIVCRDDLIVVKSDADERSSGLQAPFLIDKARDIISAMMAFTAEEDTGHQALAAEKALGRAVDAAKRRYRRWRGGH